MTIDHNDDNQLEASPTEVKAAVMAVLKALAALRPSATLSRPVRASLLNKHETEVAPVEVRPEPTPEAREAAQEVVLATFPVQVQRAAREKLKRLSDGKPIVETKATSSVRPWPFPSSLPMRRPDLEVPPFPAAGLDDPHVRKEWDAAHRAAAEARFLIQPTILKAYADAQLACEKWDAVQRGRKPSGDLRHPVPRDRLRRIMAEMTDRHQTTIARSERTLRAIETGDVVGVSVDGGFTSRDDGLGIADDYEPLFVTLILQSDLDRKAAAQRARYNRTPEEVAAEGEAWDRMVEEMISNLPPEEPEVEIPNLPDLPTDREPTAGEIWALSNAVGRHMAYLKKGEQIEAKRKKDAQTKLRTSARRTAELADPIGTATAKEA